MISIKIITARNTEKNRSIEDDFVHIQIEKKKKYITIESNSVLFVAKDYKRIERFGQHGYFHYLVGNGLMGTNTHKNMKTHTSKKLWVFLAASTPQNYLQ